MANALLPLGRTTPVAAWVALRDNGPLNTANRTRSVTSSTTKAGPSNGAGVSGPKLGGTTTLQNLAKL